MVWTGLPAAESLAVFLRKSQSHVGQELITSHVGLRGEILGEHVGDDHLEAVRQELRGREKRV